MATGKNARPIKDMVSEAQAAAARLRDAKQAQVSATDDTSNDRANEQADSAQHDLDAVNAELVQRTGQSVTTDGLVETGWAREMIVKGRSDLDVSEVVRARLVQGGVEATGDLSDEEVLDRQARLREQERQGLRDAVIKQETGRDPDELTEEQVRRALRNAAIKEADGAGLLVDRPVVGYDPLDDDDEEVADGMNEMAHRLLVAEFVDKPVAALTPADMNAYAKHANELALEAIAGKPLKEMTAIERMQAQGRLNESVAEAHRNAGKKPDDTEAGNDAGGTGTGTGTGGGGDTGSTDINQIGGRVAGGDEPADNPDAPGTPAPGNAPTGGGAHVEAPPATSGGGSTDPAPAPAPTPAPSAPPGNAGSQGTSQPANSNEPVDVMFQSSHGRLTTDGATDGGATGADSVMLTFSRTEDGRWFDEAGHEVTDPATIAALEGDWEAYQEAGGTATDAGTVTPSNTTFEQAVASATNPDNDGDGQPDAEKKDDEKKDEDGDDSGDDDNSDDDNSDDDSDDDTNGDDSTDDTQDDTNGDDGAADDNTSGEGAAGGDSTPNPEGEYTDWEGTLAFWETPLGKSEGERQQDALDQRKGGGYTDPADTGETGGSAAGGMVTTGGDVDPYDELDVVMPNIGLLDVVAATGGGTMGPVEGGDDPVFPTVDNPIIGAPKPGFGGGLHAQSGFLRATVPSDDPDGDGVVGDDGSADTTGDMGDFNASAFDLADTGHLSLGLHLAIAADLQVDTDALDLGE